MGYILNNRMDTGSFPFYMIEGLMEVVEIPNFLETGTAGGESIKKAASLFKTCNTIELIESRATEFPFPDNITFHVGNSVDILPKLIDELIKQKEIKQEGYTEDVYNYAMFFLDAHYTDPEPNTTDIKECPLLDELNVISRYNLDSIIVIDDARLFLAPPPHPLDPRQWPSIQEIFSLLNEKYPFNIHTIRDDFIISFPSRIADPFNKEWIKYYKVRFPDDASKLKSEAKNVFNAIKEYLQ